MTRPLAFEDYASIEAVNQSSLKSILKSPKQYQHDLAHPRKESPALRFGRAADVAATEPREYARQFVIMPEGPMAPDLNLSTKAGKERRAAWNASHPGDEHLDGDQWRAKVFASNNPGATVLSADEHRRAWDCGEAIRESEYAHLLHGEQQAARTWTDPKTGVLCKGRFDVLNSDEGRIVDIKTCMSIDEGAFSRDVAKFLYHFQACFYRRGVYALTGRYLDYVLLAVEKFPPHDVGAFPIEGDALQRGNELVDKALTRYAECRRTGRWPGRHTGMIPIVLPAYAMFDDEGPDAPSDGPIME